MQMWFALLRFGVWCAAFVLGVIGAPWWTAPIAGIAWGAIGPLYLWLLTRRMARHGAEVGIDPGALRNQMREEFPVGTAVPQFIQGLVVCIGLFAAGLVLHNVAIWGSLR